MVQSKLLSITAESQMMSKVNKSRSNGISILFIDLEITTEELNAETVPNILGGGGQGMACGSIASHYEPFCANDFFKTM